VLFILTTKNLIMISNKDIDPYIGTPPGFSMNGDVSETTAIFMDTNLKMLPQIFTLALKMTSSDIHCLHRWHHIRLVWLDPDV
jgi:hypothetical protein